MSTPSTPSRLPGNDGSWFLEAAGVDVGSGEARTEAKTTAETAHELWETSTSGDQPGGLTPGERSRMVQRPRSARWPMIAAGAVILAVVVGLLLWLPGTSQRRADAIATEYEAAYAAILGDLPPGQQALATLTEPTSQVQDFAATEPVIADMQVHADEALTLAAEPLPRPWPLASNQPFVALGPYRDSLSVQATSSEAISRRLGDLLDYRTLADRILAVGELPTDPAAADVDELGAQLAAVADDSATAISELPSDAALADHQAAGREAVQRFTEWQVEYLEAMRTGNGDGAILLVEELQATTTGLDQLMLEALGRIRSEVDADIIELAGSIDRTLTQLRS